jgi:hypothetical protein
VRQLAPEERLVLTTRGHCDCGSPLFGKSVPLRAPLRRQIRELRRKGWSETKIKSWMTAAGGDASQTLPPGILSTAAWADFLDEALAMPTTPFVGICGHTYQGALDTERFAISQRVRQDVAALRSEAFEALGEDVLYEFHKKSAKDRAGPRQR